MCFADGHGTSGHVGGHATSGHATSGHVGLVMARQARAMLMARVTVADGVSP